MQFEWGTIVRSVNWTLVLHLINFAILLYLLKRLLFKPALEYLDARREQIAQRMASAREHEAEAEGLVAQRADALSEARRRAERMVKDAQTRSSDILETAKRDARSEAERILADARARALQERDEMIRNLKAAYADITMLGAERILDREVNRDDHRRLLEMLAAEIDEDVLRVRP